MFGRGAGGEGKDLKQDSDAPQLNVRYLTIC
jgi:hypothetical protein